MGEREPSGSAYLNEEALRQKAREVLEKIWFEEIVKMGWITPEFLEEKLNELEGEGNEPPESGVN